MQTPRVTSIASVTAHSAYRSAYQIRCADIARMDREMRELNASVAPPVPAWSHGPHR